MNEVVQQNHLSFLLCCSTLLVPLNFLDPSDLHTNIILQGLVEVGAVAKLEQALQVHEEGCQHQSLKWN